LFFGFAQCISAFGFSLQSDDPLLDMIFVDPLRTRTWSTASQAVFAQSAPQADSA
jgi:hypothetical protein